eukprot:NP_493019.3 F-box A protein [Caenorhabditis elegans]
MTRMVGIDRWRGWSGCINDEDDSSALRAAPTATTTAPTSPTASTVTTKKRIIYKFLKAYDTFCEVLGDDFMEYREFDFWYYKIGNGDANLTCKMSYNPKSPIFTDFPDTVVHTVLEKLLPAERMVVRNVSKKLRNLFDERYRVIKNVYMQVQDEEAILFFENHEELEKTFSCNGNDGNEKYLEIALEKVAKFTKNHKLEEFEVHFDDEAGEKHRWGLYDDVSDMFKASKAVLNTKKFSIELLRPDDAKAAFSHFKPGNLEDIEIEYFCTGYKYPKYPRCPRYDDDSDDSFEDNMGMYEQLTELAHWQKAKKVKIGVDDSLDFSIEALFHLENFEISLNKFTKNDAIKIRDVLLQTAHFQSGIITFSKDPGGTNMLKVFNPKYSGGENGPIIYKTKDSRFEIGLGYSSIEFKRI